MIYCILLEIHGQLVFELKYFSKIKKPVIRELCTDVLIHYIQYNFESLMKKIFNKKILL